VKHNPFEEEQDAVFEAEHSQKIEPVTNRVDQRVDGYHRIFGFVVHCFGNE
jgi:hypothetical protein